MNIADRNKYPTEIFEFVRQRLGLEYDDTSLDEEIIKMSKNEVFKHVVNWNGLIQYDAVIKDWITDIYEIDLDEIE